MSLVKKKEYIYIYGVMNKLSDTHCPSDSDQSLILIWEAVCEKSKGRLWTKILIKLGKIVASSVLPKSGLLQKLMGNSKCFLAILKVILKDYYPIDCIVIITAVSSSLLLYLVNSINYVTFENL